jgi:pyruvate-formate lyase-activating enzyme
LRLPLCPAGQALRVDPISFDRYGLPGRAKREPQGDRYSPKERQKRKKEKKKKRKNKKNEKKKKQKNEKKKKKKKEKTRLGQRPDSSNT